MLQSMGLQRIRHNLGTEQGSLSCGPLLRARDEQQWPQAGISLLTLTGPEDSRNGEDSHSRPILVSQQSLHPPLGR